MPRGDLYEWVFSHAGEYGNRLEGTLVDRTQTKLAQLINPHEPWLLADLPVFHQQLSHATHQALGAIVEHIAQEPEYYDGWLDAERLKARTGGDQGELFEEALLGLDGETVHPRAPYTSGFGLGAPSGWWPGEAEARLADAAWATVERRGSGQVILFAESPVFRGSWHGTARLLANALILGPGAGARQPMGL